MEIICTQILMKAYKCIGVEINFSLLSTEMSDIGCYGN